MERIFLLMFRRVQHSMIQVQFPEKSKTKFDFRVLITKPHVEIKIKKFWLLLIALLGHFQIGIIIFRTRKHRPLIHDN